MPQASIIGIDQALAYLKDKSIHLDEISLDFLLELAAVIEKDAKGAAPVKTGFMKAMIRTEQQGKDVIIGAFADYSGFVDGGTSKMPARPFLSSAVQINTRKELGIWARVNE